MLKNVLLVDCNASCTLCNATNYPPYPLEVTPYNHVEEAHNVNGTQGPPTLCLRHQFVF